MASSHPTGMSACHEVATKIEAKLNSSELFSLPELKHYFVEVVRYIKTTAQKEFQMIQFFETLIKAKNIPIRKLDVQQQGLNGMLMQALQHCVQNFEPSHQQRQQFRYLNCLEEQLQLIVDLHNAVIRVCYIAEQMRGNRLRLVADMIQQLEIAGELVPATGELDK